MVGFVRKVLLKLVLEDAILREERAYRFYETALQRVGGGEERELLKKLCAEELRHRLKLEELQRRGEEEELEVGRPPEIELGGEEQSWPEVPARATCTEILKLALLKEKQAARYYQLVAGRSVLRTVRDLFFLLAAEETEHVRWVERMLEKR